jgi:hypothetical protein
VYTFWSAFRYESLMRIAWSYTVCWISLRLREIRRPAD